jgi:hypothetical protein
MLQMAGKAVEMIRRQQYLGADWKADRKYCRGELVNSNIRKIK